MRRSILALCPLISLTAFVARPAGAFENQWHLGGGLGVASYDRRPTIAPLLGLHGAYGISDVFDARLEVMGSLHSSALVGSALLGLTYKLDVIQLIPWAGLGVGGYAVADELAGKGRNPLEPGAAVLFGLDYAWSREWGFSLAAGLHFLPFAEDKSAVALRYTTCLLRVEHRWGW